jgi:hypothetical protein
MSDLMQKLALSKKIMDKHNQTPRGQASGSLPMNESINATYNIPQEMVNQQPQAQQPVIQQSVTMNQPVSQDAIKNSKLPDEIKNLMMENPIAQPQMGGPILSDDIIEGAARLMGQNRDYTPISESKPNIPQNTTTNNSDLKQMIRDVVRDTVRDVVKEELQNAGLISESIQKTNETLSLRVGKHVFEGKVLKIRKVKQ